jgi:hypothetical protein
MQVGGLSMGLTAPHGRSVPLAPGWWSGEEAVRISDLPRLVPPLPDGRRVSLASVYRWVTAGLDGVRLRRFRLGGVWHSTRQELDRWAAELTRRAGGDA